MIYIIREEEMISRPQMEVEVTRTSFEVMRPERTANGENKNKGHGNVKNVNAETKNAAIANGKNDARENVRNTERRNAENKNADRNTENSNVKNGRDANKIAKKRKNRNGNENGKAGTRRVTQTKTPATKGIF